MLELWEKKEITIYDKILAIHQLCENYKTLWDKVKEHLPELLDDKNLFKLKQLVEEWKIKRVDIYKLFVLTIWWIDEVSKDIWKQLGEVLNYPVKVDSFLELKHKLQELTEFFETKLSDKDKTISEQIKEIKSMKKIISDLQKNVKLSEEFVNTYGSKIFNIQQILEKSGYEFTFENLENTISEIIKENKKFEVIIAWLKEKKILLPDQNGKIKVNPLIKSLLSNQKVVEPVKSEKKVWKDKNWEVIKPGDSKHQVESYNLEEFDKKPSFEEVDIMMDWLVELQETLGELEQLKNKLQKKNTEILNLQNQLQEKNNKITQLTEENQKLKGENEELKKEIEKLKAKLVAGKIDIRV